MENLIIILLGIAAAAYSAYRKNQKSQASSEADGRDNEASDSEQQYGESMQSERDYVEEYFGKQGKTSSQEHSFRESSEGQRRFRNPRLEEAYEQQRVATSEKSGLPAGNKTETKQNNYKKSTYEKHNQFQPEEKKRTTTTKYPKRRSKAVHHWFDLRRAIISSEILNRKY
ncbi:MAG: hypothetical protein K9I47_11230 [Bacteroidales bacterium]|nr:hypothetical protein [Bacteroidales bacterium]